MLWCSFSVLFSGEPDTTVTDSDYWIGSFNHGNPYSRTKEYLRT